MAGSNSNEDEEKEEERAKRKSIRGVIPGQVWEYRVQELRGKARYYSRGSRATVVKSDKLVDSSLYGALEEAFKTLQDDQAGSPPPPQQLQHGARPVWSTRPCTHSSTVEAYLSGKGSVIPSDEVTWDPYWSSTYCEPVGAPGPRGTGQVPVARNQLRHRSEEGRTRRSTRRACNFCEH